MTLDELNQLPAAELDAMSDEQLAAYLAPLIPLVRAGYTGKAEATIILAPDKRTSKKVLQQKADMLLKYIEMQKAGELNQTTPIQ